MFTAIKSGVGPVVKSFGSAVVMGAGAAVGVGIARATLGWMGDKLTKISDNSKVKQAERKVGKAAQEVAAQAA